MGCCSDKKSITEKHEETPNERRNLKTIQTTVTYNNISTTKIEVKSKEKEEDIKKLQEEFINEFMEKTENDEQKEEKRTGIFIKSEKKKVLISKDLIKVEDEFILTTKINENSSFNSFWYQMVANVDKLKFKKFYIEDKEVNDSDFQIDDNQIQIKFPNKLRNEEKLKIKVIQENSLDKEKDYEYFWVILNNENAFMKYIIYGVDNIIIDDISNKLFKKDQKLNLVYFEGKIPKEIVGKSEYAYFSKKINFEIYNKIPNFESKESEIISNKEADKIEKVNVLANYKYYKITEEGQEIEEILKLRASNYPSGRFTNLIKIGLMKETDYDVDYVKLNGKNISFIKAKNEIKVDNLCLFNNQCCEFHLKYKYYTNKKKNVYRQESIISNNLKNSYYKCIIEIPNKYICLSTEEIFMKDPAKPGFYIYEGISNQDEIYEKIKFSIQKGKWDIEKIVTISAEKNIEDCTFISQKYFKGGNLKERSYEIIKDDATFEDKENKYIFKYSNLNRNVINIIWKVKVENSTSEYKNDRVINEYLTKIPEEDKQFFKDLADKIISENKLNIPNYKKIGKWVYNYIKYDLGYKGKIMTAKEIYNTKKGICEHFTLLFNTLLVSIGIDAVNISGYALNKTEDDDKKMDIHDNQKDDKNLLTNENHAWSLAKINGFWTPFDATWNLFDGNVPLSHIFQNFGNDTYNINFKINNPCSFKITKEVINFIGN